VSGSESGNRGFFGVVGKVRGSRELGNLINCFLLLVSLVGFDMLSTGLICVLQWCALCNKRGVR